jgi:hypothetical protein
MSLLTALLKNTGSQPAKEVETPIDMVTYVAGLVSNPTEIDKLLDEVRKITATRSPEAGLSAEDEATLITVYYGIEDYLVTRDPIRTYTKAELRGRFNPDLLSKLTAYEAKGAN